MYRSHGASSDRQAIHTHIHRTTQCQSSERKGNLLFLLLCVAHTSDGNLILKFELGYTVKQRRHSVVGLDGEVIVQHGQYNEQ